MRADEILISDPGVAARHVIGRSITTTVDLYGHLVPEASGRARDALDRAFAPTAMCSQSTLAAL
jgi:hypothetical protein